MRIIVTKIAQAKRERRFRASIYVDVFVPETDNLEADRAAAEEEVKNFASSIPNSYVGGVAYYTPRNLMKPLDREI